MDDGTTAAVGGAASDGADSELLILRLGGVRVALPTGVIERIEPMVALTPLGAAAPAGVVGVVEYRGTLLLVVDPRPAFGLPTPAIGTEQHLVVVAAPRRYLLWVDAVERLVSGALLTAADGALGAVAAIATWRDGSVPVLDPDVLDPGPLGQATGREAMRRGAGTESGSGLVIRDG